MQFAVPVPVLGLYPGHVVSGFVAAGLIWAAWVPCAVVKVPCAANGPEAPADTPTAKKTARSPIAMLTIVVRVVGCMNMGKTFNT